MIYHRKNIKGNVTHVSFAYLAQVPSEMIHASRATRVGWLLAAFSCSTSFAARPRYHVEDTSILKNNLLAEVPYMGHNDMNEDLLSSPDLASRVDYLLCPHHPYFDLRAETPEELRKQMWGGFFRYQAFANSPAVFEDQVLPAMVCDS